MKTKPKDEIIMEYLQTEAMIAELKKRGLGVYNMNYVFMYKPTEEGALTYETDPIKA